MKKVNSFVVSMITVFVLIFSFIGPVENVFAEIEIQDKASFTTTLKDMNTKADKMTFTVWAKDKTGNKISGSNLKVTNNDVLVPINWDDLEKTTYVLNLSLGVNIVKITSTGATSLNETFTIVREAAEDGDEIGTYIFSLEATTVGLGYLIDPVEVPIIKGENAAQHLDRMIKTSGYDYENSGKLTMGFYLEAILDAERTVYHKTPIVPQILQEKLEKIGATIEPDRYEPEYGLGEFDFNSMSGWMYALNNVFPNVGFADSYLQQDDVMRVQYTLAYGNDIGGADAMGGGYENNMFEKVNRDDLVRAIAKINSSKNKEDHLKNAVIKKVYDDSYKLLENVSLTQKIIDDKEIELAAFQVENVDKIIEEISSLSVDSSDEEVTSVSDHYNGLNNEAKQLVTNSEKLKEIEQSKLDKKEAAKVIEKIKNIGSVTLDTKEKIDVARNEYNDLTDTQKDLVTNYEELEKAEIEYARLVSEKEIKDVEALIDQIGKVNKDSKESIDKAREAFNRLKEEQQSEVTNKDVLEEAEKTYADLIESIEKAKIVTSKIDSIGNVTLESDSEIKEAREAYDKLSEVEKEMVKNYDTLTQAEEKLSALIFEKEIKDVEALIDAIGNIEIDSKKKIEQARESYDRLQVSQKEKVSNLSVLEKAEKDYTNLVENKKIAEKVINQINELGNITLNSSDAISEVRKAYDKLTKEQKLFVLNYEVLEAAEKQYDLLLLEKNENDLKAAVEVQDLITSLGKITINSEQSIKEARQAYLELTETQKELVTNVSILDRAEEEFTVIFENKKTADIVNQKIEEIGEITLDSESSLILIKEQYDDLTDDQKAFVTNYARIEEAFKEIEKLKETVINQEAAEKVDIMISKIGEVTLDSELLINEALNAYTVLTLPQKELVKNHSVLEASLRQLNELKKEEEILIDDVIKLIDDLPSKITLSSQSNIEIARAKFNALNKEQQERVANISKLAVAEMTLKEKYDSLSNLNNKIKQLIDVTLKDEAAINTLRKEYDLLDQEEQKLITEYPTLVSAEKHLLVLKSSKNAAEAYMKELESLQKITINDKEKIERLRSQYDAFNDEVKVLITNIDLLKDAETKLAELVTIELSFAKHVITLIEKLPISKETDTLASEQSVKDVRQAYDNLSTFAKSNVTNYEHLLNAEQYELDKQAAKVVEELISEIKNVTKNSKETIKTARVAYDKLTKTQKDLVTNYDILLEAEKKFKTLDEKDETVSKKRVPTTTNKTNPIVSRGSLPKTNEKTQNFQSIGLILIALTFTFYYKKDKKEVIGEK